MYREITKKDGNMASQLAANAYTADSIEEHQNLDHIRLRPNGYIGTRGIAGQVKTIWEIISNSVDELVLAPDGGNIWIGFLVDPKKNRYQIFVKDTGRGIPKDKLVDVETKLHVSGKMGSGAYIASSGQFGIGAKVAVALSKRCRAITCNTFDGGEVGSLYLEDGRIKDHHDEKLKFVSPGVITVVELDLDQYFEEVDEFMAMGYLDLIAMCKEFNVFNEKLDFKFFIYDRWLPDHFWKDDTATAINVIDDFINNRPKTVAYDAAAVMDKTAYLYEMWKLETAVIYQANFDKFSMNANDPLSFRIKLFFTKRNPNKATQYFINVNTVTLTDKTGNSPTVVFVDLLRKQLAKYITEDNYRDFVLSDYRFPTMCLAIDVRQNGAELGGVLKNTYKDAAFARQYSAELQQLFNQYDDNYWKQLVDKIKPDIVNTYAQYYDTPTTKSEGRKVFIGLHFPEQYHECIGGTDHDELYLVEGRSAGNIVTTRNNAFQAIYETRGKPTNFASAYGQMKENRDALLKNPIYQDLMHIINVGPNTTNMEVCRYKKIIIAADADPDGYHISSLHLNNFAILNPRIIESGMVYLANPPLYSMNLGGKDRRLFLRDKAALIDARIDYIYKPVLDLKIATSAGTITPSEATYREICYIADHVGELFSQVADQLNIPLLILERLVLAAEYIIPEVQYLALIDYFKSSDPTGYIKVRPEPESRSIVVSVGMNDFPISLDAAGPIIRDHLLPAVIKFKYRDLTFLVTSKQKGSTIHEQPMSMMMFYLCLEQLNQLFKVSRYKGLGQMPTDSCYSTLMNPATRSLTRITSIGNMSRNYELLGKDTTEKKRLLTASTLIDNKFMRTQKCD